MQGRGKSTSIVVVVATAVVFAACARPGPPRLIPGGPTPACPYVEDWPPYGNVGVPAGLAVARITDRVVRVLNTTSREWTIEGQWFEWLPCMGVTLSRGDPVILAANTSVEVTIQDPAWNMEPPLPDPTRIGVAFSDHACTVDTCGDLDNPVIGFWWVEIPTPTQGPLPT
jgi:hypothetical protein